jgi:uncharacterized protein YhaN
MKLKQIYIDGFGIFSDVTIDGLHPSLTIFQGNNEAGKSTLLGFIRAILFGFPDGRSTENPYPPLAGGRHGGNIVLLSNDGKSYTVERFQGTKGGKVEVRTPEHTTGGTDLLNRLTGMTNRSIFKNIYAFSLSELQSIESLNTDEVREVLFSASAGIDPNILSSFKASLEKKEGELFKPSGTKPVINKVLSQLASIINDKKILQYPAEEYDRIKSRLSVLKNEISTCEGEKNHLIACIRKNSQWVNIFPEWINLSLAEEKLEGLDPVETFPANGLARLEGFSSRLEALREELFNKEKELSKRESLLLGLNTDSSLLEHAISIKQLQEDQNHFDAILQEIGSLDQEISMGTNSFNERLDRLGPSWSEKKVRDFDLSISTGEEVRNFREELNRIKQEKQSKRETVEQAASKKREAEASFNALDEPDIKDHEELNQQIKACRELSLLREKKEQLKDELRHTEERRNDLREEKKRLDVVSTGLSALLSRALLITVFSGTVLLFLVGFISSWTAGLGILLISVIVGTALLLVRKKLQRRSDTSPVISRITDLEKTIADLKENMEQTRKLMTAPKSVLQLAELFQQESLTQIEQKLSEQVIRLNQWKDAENQLNQAAVQHDQAEEKLHLIQEKHRKTQSMWQELLKKRGLDPVLSPDGVLDTFSLIQVCKELLQNLILTRSKKSSLEDQRDKYLDLAGKILQACRKKKIKLADIRGEVPALIRELVDTEQAKQKQQLHLREIEAVRENIKRLKNQIEKVREEQQGLIASGGADSEEHFRHRGNIFEEQSRLKKEIEHYEDSIKRLAHSLDTLEAITSELKNSTQEELVEEGSRLSESLNDVESRLDRLKSEHATLEEQIRQLINDDRISEIRTKEEELIQELSSYAEEWAGVRLTQMLIRMARKKFENQQQPGVRAEAGRFFKQMTDNGYQSIMAPIGENRIEVVCKDSSRKELTQLSRGTAEQLYLSLRFGFIREFTKTSIPLPVIMDEILVNFDRQRALATARGILELSREHQVLYFTCHSETVKMFRQVAPDTTVLKIAAGKITGKPH